MARYKITLIGLYSYSDALFDQMELPNTDPAREYNIDRDVLISTILERAGDFPVLYPNYDFMQYMIGVWSKNCAYMFNKLLDTMNAKYNPMENYDRTSTVTRQGTNTGAGTSTTAQTSFDSVNFRDTDKTTASNTDTVNETVTDNTHGNIGVRSGQELIQQSRDVAMFNLYEIITRDFINRFCIEVY